MKTNRLKTDNTKTDNQLIAEFITTQNKAAFAELVNRHQNSIRQFLRRLTAGNYHLADDIAQETFLAMFRKLHTFKGNASLSTWLHKIAYHRFLKQVENSKRHEWLAQDNEPSACYENELMTDIILERLMARLSVVERLVLTLAYSAGMSHSEIVDITGLALGTVKSHINRGKQKLAELVSVEPSNLNTTETNKPDDQEAVA